MGPKYLMKQYDGCVTLEAYWPAATFYKAKRGLVWGLCRILCYYI